MLQHLDLCAGIGGFSLAAERVGFNTLYHAEVNPFASAVLAKNFPGARNLGDLRGIEGDWLRDFAGVDLLTAGFPCTDLSVCSHGSHLDLEGEDSGLFFEVARLVWEIDPAMVVFENVPRLLKFLDVIRQEIPFMEFAGGIFEASEYGASSRRSRAFIVGCAEPDRAQRIMELAVARKTLYDGADVLPMMLPWKGGVSLERLGSCVVEPIEARTVAEPSIVQRTEGPQRGIEGQRYLAIGNSLFPGIPQTIMECMVQAIEEEERGEVPAPDQGLEDLPLFNFGTVREVEIPVHRGLAHTPLARILAREVHGDFYISSQALDRLYAVEGAKVFNRCAAPGPVAQALRSGDLGRDDIRVRKVLAEEGEVVMGYPPGWTRVDVSGSNEALPAESPTGDQESSLVGVSQKPEKRKAESQLEFF